MADFTLPNNDKHPESNTSTPSDDPNLSQQPNSTATTGQGKRKATMDDHDHDSDIRKPINTPSGWDPTLEEEAAFNRAISEGVISPEAVKTVFDFLKKAGYGHWQQGETKVYDASPEFAMSLIKDRGAGGITAMGLVVRAAMNDFPNVSSAEAVESYTKMTLTPLPEGLENLARRAEEKAAKRKGKLSANLPSGKATLSQASNFQCMAGTEEHIPEKAEAPTARVENELQKAQMKSES